MTVKTVYIDQNQSELFGSPYFEGGQLIAAADALLNSKAEGYDAEHTALLSKFAGKTLILNRNEEDAPGWWFFSSKDTFQETCTAI